MEKPYKWLSSVSTMAAVVAGGLVLFLMVWITVSVFSRYVLNSPFPAADEVAELLFVVIVFLGLGYTLFAGGHIRLGLVLTRLQGQVRRGFEIGAILVGLAFATFLLWGIGDMTVSYFIRGTLSWGALHAPLIYPGILATLGALLFVSEFLRRLVLFSFRREEW